MSGFVRNRNAPQQDGRPDSPAAKKDVENLKMAVPMTSNSSATRQKPERRKSGRESAEGKKSRSKPREQSQPKNVLYDTDTGSLDDTSTTASAQQTRHAGRAQHHTRQSSTTHQTRPQQQAAGRDRYVKTVEDDSGDELQDDPLQNRPQEQNMYDQMLGQANAQTSRHTIPDTYIKGDSYPPTTSGNPSVTDGRGRTESDVSTRPPPPPAQSKPAAFTVRGGGGQRQQLPQRGTTNGGQQQSGVPVTQNQNAVRPKKSQAPVRAASPQSETFGHAGSEDFSFAPQQQSRKVAAPAQQVAHNNSAPILKAENSDAPAKSYPPRPLQQAMPRATITPQGTRQHGQRSDHAPKAAKHNANLAADAGEDEPAQDEQFDDEQAYPHPEPHGGQVDPQMQYEQDEQDLDGESYLDCSRDEIVSMSYGALKLSLIHI